MINSKNEFVFILLFFILLVVFNCLGKILFFFKGMRLFRSVALFDDNKYKEWQNNYIQCLKSFTIQILLKRNYY